MNKGVQKSSDFIHPFVYGINAKNENRATDTISAAPLLFLSLIISLNRYFVNNNFKI